MPKIKIQSHHAKPTSDGHFSVAFYLNGTPDPFPAKIIDVKTTAQALEALEAYKAEAAATGLPMAICMSVLAGNRAPGGFKAANAPFYRRLNV